MKKYIYINVDTNDADYVANLAKINDKQLSKLMPLITAIKEYTAAHPKKENYPVSEYCDNDPKDLYPEISEEIFEIFQDYIGSWDCHTIEEIKILDVAEETDLMK